MNDDDLASGLIFGGLTPEDEETARARELADPDFAALVADFAETSAALAQSGVPVVPSADITSRILAIPQGAPGSTVPEPAVARPSRWKTATLALAGVSAAAAAVLAVVVADLSGQVRDLREDMVSAQAEVSDLNRLMLAPDLTIREAALPGDDTATITVLASVDESLVRVQTANVRIADGQDMQMWLMSADGAEPMGLIDPANPVVETLPIPPGAELGFTMEPEGGSDELDGPPVVSITL